MTIALTRTFAVDGVQLAWDRWGADDGSVPLLLCHGFSGSAHDFALHVEPLAAHGPVITPDLRGHGRSTKLGTLEGYSVDRLAADLAAFIEQTVDGPVDLLGHSMGGAVSLRVTLAHPHLVRSLVLMDTSAWSFLPTDPNIAALISGFMASFDPSTGLPDLSAMPSPEQPLIDAAVPAEWQAVKRQMDAAFDPYAMQAFGRALFDPAGSSVRDRLGEIHCPVSVIVGEHDHPFVDQAPELTAEVPDGRLMVIAGAYHSPQLTHPVEWAAAVADHLARV